MFLVAGEHEVVVEVRVGIPVARKLRAKLDRLHQHLDLAHLCLGYVHGVTVILDHEPVFRHQKQAWMEVLLQKADRPLKVLCLDGKPAHSSNPLRRYSDTPDPDRVVAVSLLL